MLKLIDGHTNIISEKGSSGDFYRLKNIQNTCEQILDFASYQGSCRILASYRFNACWMLPKLAARIGDVPLETQHLIIENTSEYSHKFTMVYALVAEKTRASFFGESSVLKVRLETGDADTFIEDEIFAYVISGDDVTRMTTLAAEDISSKLGTCELSRKKKVPKFVDKLGFCTYNAFYDNISHDKILTMLNTFAENKLKLGFVIVDAGWQDEKDNVMLSFYPDKTKFPNGLSAMISEAKSGFGVDEIFMWHAYNGYWCGLDDKSFPQYDIEKRKFWIAPHLKDLMDSKEMEMNTATAGMSFYPLNLIDFDIGLPRVDLYKFYSDFYSYMRSEGVGGTKLDAMSWIESFGQGRGGRVTMMRQLVRGLEKSSEENFAGEHINCSCCSNDHLYNSLVGNVTRTSTDYFPDIPESHGVHLWTNAVMSMWMGEIILPDWDMFMSGGTAGEMHAKSRSISGGPVYCTDNLDTIDYSILKRVCDSNANTGRCLNPGRILPSMMFKDPTAEKILLKIYNKNRFNLVLGVFNCSYVPSDNCVITEDILLRDIPGVELDKTYVVYSDVRGYLGVICGDGFVTSSLATFESEIITLAPLKNNVAIIGMLGKYNPGGFVKDFKIDNDVFEVKLTDGGDVGIYFDGDFKVLTTEKGILMISI